MRLLIIFLPILKSIFTVLFFGLVVGIAGLPLGALAQGPTNQNSLTRPHEPVLVSGGNLELFWGVSLAELRLYIYQNGTWVGPIPAQVDERDSAGRYVSLEDGLLDVNDHLVFMAADLGSEAPHPFSLRQVVTISPTIYTLNIRDPLETTQQGWAYLVRVASGSALVTQDYAAYNAVAQQFETDHYTLGYGQTHLGIETLTLGGVDLDLLDRSKLRVVVNAGIFGDFTITEDDIGIPDGGEPTLITDGPVRALVERAVRVDDDDVVVNFYSLYAAYGSMVQAIADLSVSAPALKVTHVSTTLDFSSTVQLSRLYNGNIPAGVLVDGQPDSGVGPALSPWFQLSHPNGRLVQVADPSGLGTRPQTFYQDDQTIASGDTGDQRSYGESGFFIEEGINLTSTVRSTLYLLPPASDSADNVGESLANHFANPLQITVSGKTAIEQADLTGPDTGLVAGLYPFTATVNPFIASQPITYIWQADDHPIITQTGSAQNQAAFYWFTPGSKVITVTAQNQVSQATSQHTITISIPANQPLVAPQSVSLSGPTSGSSHTPYAFTALVEPISATVPVLFTWQATDLETVVHSNHLTDSITFSWPTTGTKTVQVRVQNSTVALTQSHIINLNITGILPVYLPLVLK